MVYWALLLHFYQPPTQFPSVLRRICDEAYRPLIRLFREHPIARVTVNVSGSLTEMLVDHGAADVVAGLRDLAERGQVELVGSAKYHPILPLIPLDEVRRQITLNHQINREHFGRGFAPTGFFPPELGYGRSIVDPVLETGHRWTILGGIACPTAWPLDLVHHVRTEVGDLRVVFRDDVLSNDISFHNCDAGGFLDRLRALRGSRPSIYAVTAMDAETFGHHIRGWEQRFLGAVYERLEVAEAAPPAGQRRESSVAARASGAGGLEGDDQARPPEVDRAGLGLSAQARRDVADSLRRSTRGPAEASGTGAGEVRAVTIGEVLDRFGGGQSIEPLASSWSTTADDLAAGAPYPLWRHPANAVHDLQWQLLGLCTELTRTARLVADDEPSRRHAQIARALLDRAVHSCQFWWASRRPMWDINMVNRGTLEQQSVLLNAYKAISASGASPEDKTRSYYKVIVARDIAAKVMDHLFTS